MEQYEHLVEQGELAKNQELIRGLIIEKMSKSPLHGSIAKRLYDFFLRRIPPRFSVRQDLPLSLADSSPEPDIAMALGDDRYFGKRHPNTAALVIEVAVNRVALDRETHRSTPKREWANTP
ncbi:MAG: Uma2 family endonuclease [Chthoniobacteraceae bacterium]